MAGGEGASLDDAFLALTDTTGNVGTEAGAVA